MYSLFHSILYPLHTISLVLNPLQGILSLVFIPTLPFFLNLTFISCFYFLDSSQTFITKVLGKKKKKKEKPVLRRQRESTSRRCKTTRLKQSRRYEDTQSHQTRPIHTHSLSHSHSHSHSHSLTYTPHIYSVHVPASRQPPYPHLTYVSSHRRPQPGTS
ncbi:uncharacterized protein LY79DRAFT_316163 [Colletotrichum navitas]|uniref:Uncharacterized protein n=1 Tax=Colletotrichum navitas TaxID=681940 RepID=A0AAD8PT18_9PEZI|nr:uncharacterized protein LY79DRAFT_316163 [Colletotrichum navitas]KAK1580150.1 hypothetical protein LY79DRAFT_316163 [Colletotrichum navitas]